MEVVHKLPSYLGKQKEKKVGNHWYLYYLWCGPQGHLSHFLQVPHGEVTMASNGRSTAPARYHWTWEHGQRMAVAFTRWEDGDSTSYDLDDPLAYMALSQRVDPPKAGPTHWELQALLCSYLESILSIKQAPNADPTKGKTVVSWDNMDVQQKRCGTSTVAVPCPWRKPPEHWVKMNVDGSFYGESCSGGTCMVIRDANGAIIVSACQFLPSCQSPLESELEACRHGVALSLEWSMLRCVVKMDYSEAVKMITSGELDRSPYTAIIQEIKQLMTSCTLIEFQLIRREQNNVSHILANFGCTIARTETWPSSGFRLFATTSVIWLPN
jgi:hypothetical protein